MSTGYEYTPGMFSVFNPELERQQLEQHRQAMGDREREIHNRRVNESAAAVLNNGFPTTGSSLKPLFSTTHNKEPKKKPLDKLKQTTLDFCGDILKEIRK